ncbi:MAG TPA: leucyl aminopeptidase [Phycisphaerales bacterium]|nr:leucyl aminopeptidase [Phycisphaerales bacterium]
MQKQIIKIDVKAAKADVTKLKVDCLALGVFSDAKDSDTLNILDKKLDGAISSVRKIGDFKAKTNSSIVVYTHGKIAAERILLVGFGEKSKATMDTFRRAAAKAAYDAVGMGAKTLAVAMHYDEPKTDYEKLGQIAAEAIHFGAYRYDEFLTNGNNGRVDKFSASIVSDNQAIVNKLSDGVKVGQLIGSAQNYSRTLCNRPANYVYPQQLASEAKKMAAANGLGCTIIDDKKMAQLGMNAILAVGKGAINKPRMIILKHKAKGRARNSEPIALVGKAITFDTGGISLKPGADMHEMKMDMTGGAAVLMTMQIIAKLKLPLNVYGIICAAENRPDAGSYLPGDIITTYSGKTIEILNTDAEGRVVLSDGLEQARRLGCKTAVDVATLTGACVVALGKYKAGLFSNDDKLSERLKAAASDADEPLWQMPYGQEYIDEVKGKIADLKNIGSRWGGACNGAAFIGEFAKDIAWAHLDIAGKTDICDSMKSYTQPGSIGFGVRLLTSFLMNY